MVANRESRRRRETHMRAFSRWHFARRDISLPLIHSLSRSRFISRSIVLGVVGIFEGWGDGGSSSSNDASYVGAIKRASKEEAEESGGVRDWRHSMTSSRTVQKVCGPTHIELQIREIVSLLISLQSVIPLEYVKFFWYDVYRNTLR